jgi:hypothetical protein
MTTGTSDGIMRDFIQRMLQPDKIPPEALHGGMTPETAWARWCENRAAERDGKEVPHQKLSSAERWWFGRFDRGWQQEFGVGLGRHESRYDRQKRPRLAEHQADREAGE